VLGLVADGLTQQQIANARGVVLATVRTQVRALEHATGAKDMTELRIWWQEHGADWLRWLARLGRIDLGGLAV
jgi:DNA-binding NarL/FixJ family response regulator